jgi:hypothetical protein
VSNTLSLFGQSHTGTDVSSGSFTLGSYELVADRFLTTDGSVAITLDNFLAGDRSGAPLSVLAVNPNMSIVVNDIILTQLNGDVTLMSDGIITQISDATLTVDNITYGPSSTANSSIAFTIAQEGNVLDVPITASMSGHLDCTTTITIPDGVSDAAISIGTLTLKAGDVTDVGGAGSVDIQDATAMGAVFGGSPTGEEDINGDGVIDILDLVHIGRNYNSTVESCD